jgi:hypothetical protein
VVLLPLALPRRPAVLPPPVPLMLPPLPTEQVPAPLLLLLHLLVSVHCWYNSFSLRFFSSWTSDIDYDTGFKIFWFMYQFVFCHIPKILIIALSLLRFRIRNLMRLTFSSIHPVSSIIPPVLLP